MPSACPSTSRPSRRSMMRVVMPGYCDICAARSIPAGPDPTMSTSISSGRSSGRSMPVPAAGSTRGSWETYPWWWNCIVVDSFLTAPSGVGSGPLCFADPMFYIRTHRSTIEHRLAEVAATAIKTARRTHGRGPRLPDAQPRDPDPGDPRRRARPAVDRRDRQPASACTARSPTACCARSRITAWSAGMRRGWSHSARAWRRSPPASRTTCRPRPCPSSPPSRTSSA